MKLIVKDLIYCLSIKKQYNYISIVKQIDNSPDYIYVGIKILILIDKFIRLIIKIFNISSVNYVKFILSKKPPFIYLLYKLTSYNIILNIYNEKNI
jgi:hypothetical protein